jgi:hypothetical protein
MQRPTGITVLAILGFVVGGLHFLAAFLAFARGSMLTAEAASGYFLPQVTPFMYSVGDYGFWIGLIGMAIAVFLLAAAAGLWVLSRTGYWLTIVAIGLNLVMDVVNLFTGNASVLTLLGAALGIVALFYLSRPRIYHAFDPFPIDAPAS